MYQIFLTEEFDVGLQEITLRDRQSIEKKMIDYMAPQVKQEPHYGPNIKKLRGYIPETWRYRIGRYRLFYTINEKENIIKLVSIDQRKDAY
ncbi:MAG: type II toxin-antitoxin system mRNA interferase toxin, RelE/StbE family [Fibrobacteres bacterium]|nr:type II toxin-antitoxin system mRNA interferase toxin, RelE/StbE family [Fibrobacterota bacterium]